MREPSGAFSAPDKGHTVHPNVEDPPTRFITRQVSGGLKTLYEKLSGQKKSQKYEGGTQTDGDGRFCPCYPVPLLATRYKFTQVIGQGQSSVLISAEDLFHPENQLVAVKVMNQDYRVLGTQEAACIQQLNAADPLQVSRTIRLLNKFIFDGHYCLVFELLHPRPLRLYVQRSPYDNEEEKLRIIRKTAVQLLEVLGFLKRENVIHADMKPENILFEQGDEIRIKVIDFGNAIHCVHREVSLYYDQFELQTLLYRAPEVIFGVPFGPEIDMWSLGCILAELYIGEPLFLGRNKEEVVKQMFSLLGPFPRCPFQSGKFYSQFSGFVSQGSGSGTPVDVKLMKRLNNSPSYLFANFISGLLRYSPSERLTPFQAALHPFLARESPLAFLLAGETHLTTDTGSRSCYTDLPTATSYSKKPHVDEDISRQHFSSVELLHKGTKGSPLFHGSNVASKSPRVGKVAPLRHDGKPVVPEVSGPGLQETTSHLDSNSVVSDSVMDGETLALVERIESPTSSIRPRTKARRQKRALDSRVAEKPLQTGVRHRNSKAKTKRVVQHLSSHALDTVVSDPLDVWSINASTPKPKPQTKPKTKTKPRKRSRPNPKFTRIETSFSEEQFKSCSSPVIRRRSPAASSSKRKRHGFAQGERMQALAYIDTSSEDDVLLL